jgi:hypothetical protein
MRRINRYIVLVLIAILGVYLALLDTLAKPLFEQQATELYGAEVSIDSMSISPFLGKVTLRQLQVADRRNAMRNLAQADRAYIDIDIIKLASNIIEVEELEIDGFVLLTPRTSPATILRPLVPANSDIATAGLPTFVLPDADALIAMQRDKLDADVASFKQSLSSTGQKWEDKMASLPSQADLDAYQARIKKLKQAKGTMERIAAVAEVQKIYAEVSQDVASMQSLQQDFRGDLQRMRELVEMANGLPSKHVDELVSSLGLNSAQMAQMGSQLLRGDMSGISQQVLAPLAYNASGAVNAEDSMPIFIRRATINGSILPSAAGFAAQGQLENFAWPLELADLPAVLKLEGDSLDGGSMLIEASIDHRNSPTDFMEVNIENLSLRDMKLNGTEDLGIELNQALASVSGAMRVDGELLSGSFSQQFSKTLFNVQLGENAGGAARLLAAVLESSTDFNMGIDFSGTLQSPQLSFRSDLDSLMESTLTNAIGQRVAELTNELSNQISGEIGPEIAAAREQFVSLEKLQADLQRSLQQLSSIK